MRSVAAALVVLLSACGTPRSAQFGAFLGGGAAAVVAPLAAPQLGERGDNLPGFVGKAAVGGALIGGVIGLASHQIGADTAGGSGRVGICALNFGPMIEERTAFVRTGNMGWDYCLRADAEKAGWFVGLLGAPTWVYLWDKETPEQTLDRWSFRPGIPGRMQTPMWWLKVSAGRAVSLGPVTLRPSVGAWVPAGTDYGRWGAQVGPAPALGLEVEVRAGRVSASCEKDRVWVGGSTWTVFKDWDGRSADGDSFTARPFLCGVQLRLGR